MFLLLSFSICFLFFDAFLARISLYSRGDKAGMAELQSSITQAQAARNAMQNIEHDRAAPIANPMPKSSFPLSVRSLNPQAIQNPTVQAIIRKRNEAAKKSPVVFLRELPFQIIHGDLLTTVADALMVYETKELTMAEGLSRALKKRYGETMRSQLLDLQEPHGGQSKVLRHVPEESNFKSICFVITDNLGMDPEKITGLAIEAFLDDAAENKDKHLLIPCIGFGSASADKDTLMKALISAAKTWVCNHQSHQFETITFIE
eukprot:TRINITY_DN4576_c0_g2_i2.p1 TRINITY_DN4576_c0_g2~~TRINITY_DN4576_c0_g2_i2.p1  ORF type:complete len:261 (-),score=55.10 TRINITY_DN4576_c0_g2_i2:532-1314(-)